MTDTKKQFKILIVDDMKVNFLIIEKILQGKELLGHGFVCVFEIDSYKVQEACLREKPDLILLDFDMPGLKGPEVCTRVKAEPSTKDIPVLFVTAHTDEAKLAEAFSAGGDDYVLKPVKEKELLSRMSRTFENINLREKLQDQFEDQATLTRILSHDIKNLMTLAQSGIDMMSTLGPAVGSEDRVFFDKGFNYASTAITRIGALVSNVLELQSLDDQKLKLNLMPVSLYKVLEESKLIFSDKLKEKQITLEVTCDLNVVVLADPSSLATSVINNLISNAIKFSNKESKIMIQAAGVGSFVRVVIRDYGIGMRADLLSKVFSKTEQTSRPGTMQEKGTGFGMPIVKKYMELYGGQIQLQSRSIDESPNDSGTAAILDFKSAQGMSLPNKASA